MNGFTVETWPHWSLWQIGVNGGGKRPWFVYCNSINCPKGIYVGQRVASDTRGAYRRFASAEAAQKAADKLNKARPSRIVRPDGGTGFIRHQYIDQRDPTYRGKVRRSCGDRMRKFARATNLFVYGVHSRRVAVVKAELEDRVAAWAEARANGHCRTYIAAGWDRHDEESLRILDSRIAGCAA